MFEESNKFNFFFWFGDVTTLRSKSNNRKYVSSFTIDRKILDKFEKSIPLQSKSLTIENLIKEFLEDKKNAQKNPSISSERNAESPEYKSGDSNWYEFI